MIEFTPAKEIEEGQYYLARFNGHALSTRRPDATIKPYIGKVFPSGVKALIELDLIQGKLIPSETYEDSKFFFIQGKVSESTARRIMNSGYNAGEVERESLAKFFEEAESAIAPLVSATPVNDRLMAVYNKLKLINS